MGRPDPFPSIVVSIGYGVNCQAALTNNQFGFRTPQKTVGIFLKKMNKKTFGTGNVVINTVRKSNLVTNSQCLAHAL